ncbi:MAG TPA: hypothetical protein VGV64_00810, partial [Thermoplasmata archaeon]|nr:hypothetical protein [Thermoplasmata archaeon]
MTGAGGMGSLPSSRLTRLLQEKAEVLKKRRQNADAATERVEQRLRLLSEVEVELPETASRLERLREFQRRSDWEAVETLSKELFDYLDQQGTPAVDASRVELLHRFDDLGRVGAPASDGLTRLAEEVKTMTFGTDLAH